MLLRWWAAYGADDTVAARQQHGDDEALRSLEKYNLDDDDDDDFWSRSHYNQTVITSTVTIRVTPHDDYLVSWGILSACLILAIGWASWQVYVERKIDQVRSSATSSKGGSPVIDSDRTAESASTAEVTRCVVSMPFL